MDRRTLRIRELFKDVVPSFGISHAKAYTALMQGEIKTAKELSGEIDISHNKIYSILKELITENIVICTNTNPINYHVKSPQKTFEKLVNKKIALLEKRTEEFDKIINDEIAYANEKEYVIRFGEKQTRLFDNKNKTAVKELKEAKQIIQQLNIYVNQLEPKKEYDLALYK